eukprot:15460569-Alexandrium_andersonii.AAC.1
MAAPGLPHPWTLPVQPNGSALRDPHGTVHAHGHCQQLPVGWPHRHAAVRGVNVRLPDRRCRVLVARKHAHTPDQL